MEIPEIMPYSLENILNAKNFDKDKINKDYDSLKKWNAEKNEVKIIGNRTIYKYLFRELLKCRRDNKNYMTIYDIYNNNQEDKLWREVIKRKSKNGTHYPTAGEVFETFRINKGCVAIFKPSNAKYIYKKYNATSILDPTAGWGGRLLGASSLDIKYTGFDTNINLKTGYNKMIKDLNIKNCEMIFEDSLSYDFSNLDYDFVFTSPPYLNLELYECMKPFENKDKFYNDFLIPLMNKCFQYLKEGGKMCFNISPEMYKDLIKFGFRECDIIEELSQRKKNGNDKRQDFIYIWNKNAFNSEE